MVHLGMGEENTFRGLLACHCPGSVVVCVVGGCGHSRGVVWVVRVVCALWVPCGVCLGGWVV